MRVSGTGRIWLVLAVSLPLLLLVQGVSADASDAPQSATLAPGSQYVAMGSSYAAGFGIEPQQPSTGACGRSLLDYPHLVASKLHLQLSDVSCGGAVIADALRKTQGSNPPQINAVTAQTRAGHDDHRWKRCRLHRNGDRVWSAQLDLRHDDEPGPDQRRLSSTAEVADETGSSCAGKSSLGHRPARHLPSARSTEGVLRSALHPSSDTPG